MLEALLLEFNASRCAPPLPENEVRMIAQSIGKRDYNVPDGVWWLQQWLPHLTAPNDAKLASTLVVLQDQTSSVLSPAEAVILRQGNLSHDAYVESRTRLKTIGAIEVVARRPRAPLIRLLLRDDASV
jgi:hypothetical protein